MMDRRAFVASAAAALAVPIAACAPATPLRLGIHPWVGFETFYLAEHFGWLPDDVILREDQQPAETVQALEAGMVDAATLTLDEVLRLRGRGVALKVVAVLDISTGGDVVMARPPAASMGDLKGKRIGLADTTLSQLVLSHALRVAELTVDDVSPRFVPQARLLEAWQAGEFEALVTYEPMASMLARAGASRVFDSRQMPDTIFDVLALRQGRVNYRAVFGLLRAHFQGVRHLRFNRQDALHRIAAHQGLTLDEARHVLGGIQLPDLAANRDFLAHGSSLEAAARELSRFLVQAGLLERADTLEGLFDAQYLPDDAA